MSQADVRLAADVVQSRACGRHLLLLCDFDGTLCEFDANPDAVWLSPSRRTLLDGIASGQAASVAIVSGRRLADVKRRTMLGPDSAYAGLHGLEIESPGERYQHPAVGQSDELLGTLARRMEAELSAIPGTFLEDKEHSIVVHFRGASAEDGARAEAAMLRIAKPHLDSGVLRTMQGAFMLELMPNIEWHKGNAVDWIRTRVVRRHGEVWSVYIGDDLTDEDGFEAVRQGGVSVAASPRARTADFAVDGPAEVEALLRALAAQLTPATQLR
jgi:alpha,alpha-trehalase